MKMYIPEIGDRITLTKPWSFDLHHEDRNADMFAYQKLKLATRYYVNQPPAEKVILPKNTELRIDRIYLDALRRTWQLGTVQVDYVMPRKGAGDFSSISFWIPYGSLPDQKNHIRFWAKLRDVNTLEFKILETDPNREKSKTKSIQWNWSPGSLTHSKTGTVGGVKRFKAMFKEVRKIPYEVPTYKYDEHGMGTPTGKTEVRFQPKSYFDLFDNDKLIGCYCEMTGCKNKAREIIKKEKS